jgi:hypothetical protein
MDPQDVERLQICRDSICSDVTFDSVAPALISAGLINRDELQKILSKDSDVHRMNQVLKILPTKGPKALTKFTTVLKKDYRWLADHIMSAGASTSNGSSSNGSNSPSDQTDLNVPSTSGTSCKQRQRNSNNNNNNQTPPSSPRKIETSSPGRIKSPVVNNQQNLITECSDHITSNNENNRLAAEQLSQSKDILLLTHYYSCRSMLTVHTLLLLLSFICEAVEHSFFCSIS